MARGVANDGEDIRDERVGHGRVEEVAHGVDENRSRIPKGTTSLVL
jgi:hypothetical protein